MVAKVEYLVEVFERGDALTDLNLIHKHKRHYSLETGILCAHNIIDHNLCMTKGFLLSLYPGDLMASIFHS